MRSMAFVLGWLWCFSCPCAKPLSCVSRTLMRERRKAEIPKSPLDVKSSSTGGSSNHLKQGSYYRLPWNTLRAHTRFWCVTESKNKNKFACTIGLVAAILCISCDVGMQGRLVQDVERAPAQRLEGALRDDLSEHVTRVSEVFGEE